MRRTFLLFFCFLAAQHPSFAEKWNIGFGYRYLYSSQWDKAIQTYNFSRPFLEENQPLLIHGTYAEAQLNFLSEKKIQSAIKIDHSYFRSRANNPNLKTRLNLHIVNLSYVFRYKDVEKFKRLHFELQLSLSNTLISKRINDEALFIDDKRSLAYGIGGKVGITALYTIQLEKFRPFDAFFNLAYTPYMRTPQSESLLNQTTRLVSKKNSSLLDWVVGFRIPLKKSD